MSKNHYKLLGVAQDASADEVRRAFYKLAHIHHPDKGGDADDFRDIYSAYEVLSDPKKRKQYDNLGDAEYARENSQKSNWDSMSEESFREMMMRLFGTETPFDEYTREYPPVFTGHYTDPHTGDEYWSAEEIRIAKEERAYAKYMDAIGLLEKGLYDACSFNPERLRELGDLLSTEGWINETEREQGVQLIEKYKQFKKERGEAEELRETFAEEDEDWEEVQEFIEQADKRDEAFIKEMRGYRGRYYGHRKGMDSDERKKWRRSIQDQRGGRR